MPDYLTANQIAAKLGIEQTTWRGYVSRGDAPPPDKTLGPLNLWLVDTFEEWRDSRPGQGRRKDLETS